MFFVNIQTNDSRWLPLTQQNVICCFSYFSFHVPPVGSAVNFIYRVSMYMRVTKHSNGSNQIKKTKIKIK